MSNLPENQEPQDVEIQVGAAVMFTLVEGGAFFLAMFLGWLFSIPTLDVIHWNWQGVWLGLAATVPMLALFVLCRFAPWRPFRHLTRLVRHLLIPPMRTCRPHEIVIISGLAGLGEELLFRGILQGGAFLLLVKWLDPTTSIILAVGFASIAFGIAHAITRLYLILATILGIYLGVLWLWTDNLLVPIVAHAAYDLIAITWMLQHERRLEQRKLSKNEQQ